MQTNIDQLILSSRIAKNRISPQLTTEGKEKYEVLDLH